MARLSVNLNKVALLRNARRTGVPDLAHFARLALSAGAAGLTVHPRPDQRHIRDSDVPLLAGLLARHGHGAEFNIEGYPDERLLSFAAAHRPAQITLVPDAPDAFTSEEGWHLDPAQMAVAQPAIAALRKLGCRVVLFIDPDPRVISRVAESGAQGAEIYTGSYAEAMRDGSGEATALAAIAATARAALAAGLVVNAGHDLNLRNIPSLVAAVPDLAEASIGHELTADALEMGFAPAVAAYRAALAPGAE